MDYSRFFPIRDYYIKVVMPLDNRYRVTKGDKFICCLHDDTDPSMGIIHSKKKGEIFHCFGCNSYGTIIDLHRRVSLRFFNKHLDDEGVLRSLCEIFGISYDSLPKDDDSSVNNVKDKYISRVLSIKESSNKFDIADLKTKVIEGKIENRSIAYFNSLVVNSIYQISKDREDM